MRSTPTEAERSLQALATAISNAEAIKRLNPSASLEPSVKTMVVMHNQTVNMLADTFKGDVVVVKNEERAAPNPAPTRRGRPPTKPMVKPMEPAKDNGASAEVVTLPPSVVSTTLI